MSRGGHPFRMGRISVVGQIRTRESQPPLAPITSWVFLTSQLLLAPIAALPSPPWWWVLPLIHPVAVPPSHPRFLFRVTPGIIRLHVLLLVAIWGGILLPRLPADLAALVDVRLRWSTPFLLRFVIEAPRALSVMTPIGRNRRRTTYQCLQSRILWTSLLFPQ